MSPCTYDFLFFSHTVSNQACGYALFALHNVCITRAAGAPSLAAPAGKRDSCIIQVDVQKVREILQYLSDLEDKQALTESEVYKLEHLITVNKDQLVLVCGRVCVCVWGATDVAAGILYDVLGNARDVCEEVPQAFAKFARCNEVKRWIVLSRGAGRA